MTKIYVVDDDVINSKVFAKRLTKRGYDVTYFSSGPQCLDFFSDFDKRHDAIIILDILMPEISGLEVLSVLRKNFSPMDLPVIVMSGNEDVERIVECLSSGASDFIGKPANIDIAIARIKTQQDLLSFHRGNMKKKQLETINSMVATFNHEINNPLTIALGSLRRDFSKIDERRVGIAVNALERIANIVKKIERVTEYEVEEEVYVEDTNMIKIDH